MSKIKNGGGLDQHGAEPFEQLQFGTAGVEGVNTRDVDSQCAITGNRLHLTSDAPKIWAYRRIQEFEFARYIENHAECNYGVYRSGTKCGRLS